MKIFRYKEVTSTQSVAKKLAERGVKEGIIVADLQTEGKGRLNRKWISPKGGLYFSIILKMNRKLPLIAALAISQTMKQIGLNAKIKWPNDILIKNKKIAGILIECINEYAILGIGVNVDLTPIENATSINEEGIHLSRETLLKQILKNLFYYQSSENIIEEYKKTSDTIGRFVKITMIKGTLEGEAVDIDESGRLIIKKNDEFHSIISGDCVYLR